MRKKLNSSGRYIGRVMLLLAKRVFLLAIGFLLTYFIAWELFPALNKNFSIVTTILLTYLASAYIVIPAGIRLIRLWYRPVHIPQFVSTPDGFSCDPVNIGIVGTKHQLRVAMQKSGWHEADPKNIRSMSKLIVSILTRQNYPNAPFSSLYLFGRKQDLGFQRQVDESYFSRHHVRFWASSTEVSPKFAEHIRFWHKKLTPETKAKLLWVGAAIKDSGLGIIKYHGQLTHSVAADTNAERDLIVHQLTEVGLIKEVIKIRAGEPAVISNRVVGDSMISDGELHICILK